MMSRLNQLNDTRLTLLSLYRARPVVGFRTGVFTRCVTVTFAFGYRVPSSAMPWATFEETDQGQPAATEEAVFGQRIDGVLTAGRREPTRRKPQRGDRVAVELDEEHRAPGGPGPSAHARDPFRSLMRCSAVRSSCSSRGVIASRLLGSARITIQSEGSRSSRTARAAWRRRRDTR